MGRMLLSIGLLLYLFDYGSDIYVAVQYWKNNDTWWFGMTVGFIVVPSVIVNTISIKNEIDEWTCVSAVLQLSFFVRYIKALKSPNSKASNSKSRNSKVLAELRYLETITESAPQWCLQVYVMLRQWYFPSYTLVSSGLSLASLAWSITTLEKERAIEKEDDMESRDISLFPIRKFGLVQTVLFLIWQLFTLISRLSAIVLFAYVFRYYLIIFLAAHWLLLVVIIFLIQRGDGEGCGKYLLLSLLASFSSLFHASKTVNSSRNPKVEIIVGYIFIIVENIIMVTLSLTIEKPDVPHLDVLQPAAISCLVGGSFLSFMCFIFCWLSMDFSSSPPGWSRENEHDSSGFGQMELTEHRRRSEVITERRFQAFIISHKVIYSKEEIRMTAIEGYRHNYNTQTAADHWSGNENRETLSSRSLPNPHSDFGNTNETTGRGNNNSWQMDHPSQANSPVRTITQEDLANQSAENRGFLSSLYEAATSGATSAYNYVVSFLPWP